jgi:hypothetical protein
MRYLCMHKASPHDEAGLPPPPELVQGMQELLDELCRSGKFLAGEGLKPSSQRFRLTRASDGWSVKRGPLTGSNELPAGLAILKVGSADEALAWAQRFGAALEADELELGPLTEPWDIGMCPKPAGDVPLRCMILHKATPRTEAGTAPTPRQRAALAALTREMTAAGVLVSCEALLPSSAAVRARYRGGDRSLTDGPFAESKELIGGFCMLEMRSLEEVLAFADRFARVVGGNVEIDLRPVAEPARDR